MAKNSSKTIGLCISTPEGTVFDGEVKRVLFRTPEGDVSLLAGHHNSVFIVNPGTLEVKTIEEDIAFKIKSGNLYFKDNNAVLVATFAAKIDEYETLLKAHKQQLADRYSEEVKSEFELQRIHMALQRTLIKKGR